MAIAMTQAATRAVLCFVLLGGVWCALYLLSALQLLAALCGLLKIPANSLKSLLFG
jgi:hypothetical protein